MTAFFSEALGKHERSAFTSGNERIDGYFRQTVSQDVKRGYARLAAAPIGLHAICADAIDDAAAAFCREHQFRPFNSCPYTLYLPMKTALVLVAKATSKDKS